MFGFGRKTVWPEDLRVLASVMARPLLPGKQFISDAEIALMLKPLLKSRRRADWMGLVERLREWGDGRSAAAAYDVVMQRFHGAWPADLRAAASVFFRLKVKDEQIVGVIGTLADTIAQEDAWAAIATQLRGSGKIKCAEVIYDAALKRFPQSAKLWGNCGVLYRNQARFRDAALALNKAIALRPDYKIALHNLGSVYELSKQFDVAMPFYERVLKLDPAFAPSWTGKGICLQKKNPAEAERCYQQAIALDPNYSAPLFNLALLYVRQGDVARAKETIARFLRKWPTDEGAKTLRDRLQAGGSIDISDMENPADEQRYAIRLPKNVQWTGAQPVEHGAAVSTSLQLIAPIPDQDCFAPRPLDRFEMADPGPLPPKVERLLFKPQVLLDAPDSSYGFFQTEEMRRHVAEHLAQAPPVAPRVFLSYQRDPELASWMERLRGELSKRGYDVILDENVTTQGVAVPYVVSLIATCNVVCPVLTDGYFERIDPGDALYGGLAYMDDGWAFDEFQLAMAMASAKRAIIVGLWRSGTLLPPFKAQNVLDMRREQDLAKQLDRVFKKRR